MKCLKVLIPVACLALLAACSTPEERAAKAQERSYKAQEDVARQRLELVDKYQDCIKEAGDNAEKAKACETYLSAADALK
jgi:outer membrane biogenesis lipoprotein LolB